MLSGLSAQQYVTVNTGVSVSNMFKRQLAEDDVMRAASDAVLENLNAKVQQKRWFPAAEKWLHNDPARTLSRS